MRFVPARRAGAAFVATTGMLFAMAGCDLGEAPTTYPAPGGVAGTGDLDGDGHLDVVIRGDGQGFGVMLGDGSGGYTLTTVPHDKPCTSDDYVSCSGMAAARARASTSTPGAESGPSGPSGCGSTI